MRPEWFVVPVVLLSATAQADDLLHTTRDAIACVNPRATRALNNRADPRQQDPRWVQFVVQDGRCFTIHPDQQWSRIPADGTLLLLRKEPPTPGRPPLYFLPSDVEAVQAATPPPADATNAPDAGPQGAADQEQPGTAAGGDGSAPPSADAGSLDQTLQQLRGPSTASAPAEVTPPSTLAPQAYPTPPPASSAPVTSSLEAPNSAAARSSSSGAAGGLALLGLAIAGLAVAVTALVRRDRQRVRRTAAALDVCVQEIRRQSEPLRVSRIQKVTADQYGTLDYSRWEKEKAYFLQTRVLPLLQGAGLQDEWPNLAAEVDRRIELIAATPIGDERELPSFRSNPEVFDPRMDPLDYERHCALILQHAGWQTRLTVATGDQGRTSSPSVTDAS